MFSKPPTSPYVSLCTLLMFLLTFCALLYLIFLGAYTHHHIQPYFGKIKHSLLTIYIFASRVLGLGHWLEFYIVTCSFLHIYIIYDSDGTLDSAGRQKHTCTLHIYISYAQINHVQNKKVKWGITYWWRKKEYF
jgi:hypothetical protein